MSSGVKVQRRLSPERIIEAALRVADEEGVDALSLRRLAGVLDVTPMAIYRHVRNKSHLLDLMAERLLEQLDLAPAEESTWQERMRRLLGSYHAIAAAHPSMPLVISRPIGAPAELRASEVLLEILQDAGFDAGQSAQLVQVLAGMLLGPALHRAAWARVDEVPSDGGSEYAGEVHLAADFPLLAVVGPLINWTASAAADRLTIDLLVGGLEMLAASHPPATRSSKGR